MAEEVKEEGTTEYGAIDCDYKGCSVTYEVDLGEAGKFCVEHADKVANKKK